MAVTLTDDQIKRIAKARVSFKMHLMVYVSVNLFLVGVWIVTGGWRDIQASAYRNYWPIWTHLGWGLGLAIHGFTTYGPASDMLQREEDKIRSQMGKP